MKMDCNVQCIIVSLIFVSLSELFDIFCFIPSFSNENLFAVIEVANGDYGDFTAQLAAAAAKYQGEKIPDSDENDNMPVIKVDSFSMQMEPLLKKQPSLDNKDMLRVPSEWSKFWTLVARCQINHYRDWVSCANLLTDKTAILTIFLVLLLLNSSVNTFFSVNYNILLILSYFLSPFFSDFWNRPPHI